LCIFKEIWNTDAMIKAFEGKVIDKSLLKSTRFDYNVPSYRQMLEEQFKLMDEFSNLYKY
jgi:dTDP-4-dehydrorhamnose reductase